MFQPKTKRIENLAKIFPDIILELENIFDANTNIYINRQM